MGVGVMVVVEEDEKLGGGPWILRYRLKDRADGMEYKSLIFS